MKSQWIAAAVIVAMLFLFGLGLAVPATPRAAPTFTVAGLSVEGDVLMVRYKLQFPAGTSGTWDPEAIKAGIARLVSVEGGTWTWTIFKPELRDATPPPPPPPNKLIESFSIEPATIAKGGSAKLSWSAPKAKTVTINGVGVPVTGSQVVSPPATATYTLTAQAEGLPTETAQRVLTVSDTPPPPPPTELWGIVVEESSQRTTAQAAIITSTEIRDLLGGHFRVVDKDSEVPAEMKLYVDRAKTRKLPQFFLVDKAGTVYFEGDLPADKAGTIALIRKFKPGAPR